MERFEELHPVLLLANQKFPVQKVSTTSRVKESTHTQSKNGPHSRKSNQDSAKELLKELQATNRRLKRLEGMRQELKGIKESLGGLSKRFGPPFAEQPPMPPWGPPPTLQPVRPNELPAKPE